MSTFSITIAEPKLTDKTLSFELHGSNEYGLDKSIVNSIRRVLLTEIPTVAFNVDEGSEKDICMEVNNTSLHNEYLLHRLSLIPVYLDPTNYENQYMFYLNIKHDSNEPFRFITTNDIEIYPLKKEVTPTKLSLDDYDMNKPLSKVEKNKILKPFVFRGNEYPILITELKNTNSPNNVQELVFYGSPSVSIGKHNARYSAVSDAIYNFTIDKDLFNNIASIKANKLNLQGTEREAFIKQLFISEGERYYYRDNNNLSNKYNFTITSQHYFTSGELFKLACGILIDKLENFKENMIKYTQSTDSSITINNHSENIYHIYVSNQNDTLGNIIQSHMANHFLQPTDFLNTCGYKKTHPLEETILFIVSLNQLNKGFSKNEEQKLNLLVSYFELVVNDLITIYKEIQKQATILL